MSTPHPLWELELHGKHIGKDKGRRVAYLSIDILPSRVFYIQMSFLFCCLLIVIFTNIAALTI